MKEIPIKKYVIYLFGISILIFVQNKLYIRKWIIDNESPDFLLIVTYSIPNLIEAIIVTLILTGVLLQLREYFNKQLGSIKTVYIHVIASILAAVYVITQELKFLNLGGNNVYDPNDLLASLIGLIGTFLIIQFLAFINETEINTRD